MNTLALFQQALTALEGRVAVICAAKVAAPANADVAAVPTTLGTSVDVPAISPPEMSADDLTTMLYRVQAMNDALDSAGT